MRIETQRLFIRKFHLADDEAMKSIFCDPEVMKYGVGVQNCEWIKDWINECLENYYRKWGFGAWAVVEKKSNSVIGYCGLFYFPDINGRSEIEVGYRLAKKFWGVGYATEAAKAVIQYAFDTLCIKRLIAMVDPYNVASLGVVEKLGMIHESDVKLSEEWTHSDRVYVIERK